jgi:hypothetical protein
VTGVYESFEGLYPNIRAEVAFDNRKMFLFTGLSFLYEQKHVEKLETHDPNTITGVNVRLTLFSHFDMNFGVIQQFDTVMDDYKRTSSASIQIKF